MSDPDRGFALHPILDHDSAARWLGVTIERARYGDAEVRVDVRPELLNGFGMAHGGLIFMLAGICFALSCNDANAPEVITVAQNCDIDFLRPAFPGDVLTATSELRQGARRTSIHDVVVRNQDGKPVAEFRGRARTIPNPDAPTKEHS